MEFFSAKKLDNFLLFLLIPIYKSKIEYILPIIIIIIIILTQNSYVHLAMPNSTFSVSIYHESQK